MNESLKRLKKDCVDLFYLHFPDRSVPIEETLKDVNLLYKEGKFKSFGLSNYSAWEVAEIYYLCKINNYPLPLVYQGRYNSLSRGVEGELIPCLRRLGISFYAYSPLAGGLLTGKHHFEDRDKATIQPGRYSGDSKGAKLYASGKSEEIMGNNELLNIEPKVEIATKSFPFAERGFKDHAVLDQMNGSLKRLKKDCVDLFYLHSPDRSVPIEETLDDVNLLYKEGKFKQFGLSNYSAWEVAEIYYLCKMNGYPLPTVYQGKYNAVTRSAEGELFPCLRRLGISFYAYSPLAGGVLTGKHKFEDRAKGAIQQGRFSNDNKRADFFLKFFWKKPMFDAVDKVKVALDHVYGPGKVSLADASIRWCYHHSILDGAYGDAVIIGASSIKHLEDNIKSTKHGPLHEDIVRVFEEAWDQCEADCPLYYN
ncbi:aflatoxin B1 aldehyde reductase member 4-like isoform X5 [Acropora millepora]|nr:aflatoxin B1 aldehyde reductase member 4-like isoform X5 [Acropora millepora]XP_029212591.1 aflatoxin B1 aldehyde reductase member 4-like isoform X5 [Acropora millepora]